MGLLACLLEGRPLPSFPVCLCQLCRKHQDTGDQHNTKYPIQHTTSLQFTPALGKAVALFSEHGFDHDTHEERVKKKVQHAVHNLLRTSSLKRHKQEEESVMPMDNQEE